MMNELQQIINDKTIKPIIAYRVWSLDMPYNTIYSWHRDNVLWEPGKIIEAHCSPKDNKNFGIHAWKNMDDLLDYVTDYSKTSYIIGTVYMWGEIVEHEKGIRSQFAYPCEFQIFIHRNKTTINRKQVEINLRNAYGCEVADFEFTGPKIYEDETKINFENGDIRTIISKDGTENWRKDGTYHREDGPAFINKLGDEYWYQNGKLHRTDGPAWIDSNGVKHWYQNGNEFRTNGGPTSEHPDGMHVWKNEDGHYHRVDGPAIIYANGTKKWYFRGKLHRMDGPAIEYSYGINCYYDNGEHVYTENIK